ncbi:MAG: DUF4159 domain-containing protein [Candidatus Latescibacterota bacterium]
MKHRIAFFTGIILTLLVALAAAQPPGYSSRDDFGGRSAAAPGGREAKIAIAWGDQLKPPSQYSRSIINLKEAMAKWTQVPVAIEGQFRLGSTTLMNMTIVFISTTEQFELTETEKKNLRDYLAKGGMLVVDDAGASMPNSQSGASLRQMIKDIAGSKRLEPISSSHAIFSTPNMLGGPPRGSDTAMTKVGERVMPSGVREPSMVSADESPTLQGITMNGRLAIVYSPKGYTPKWHEGADDATLKFGVNLISYALKQK